MIGKAAARIETEATEVAEVLVTGWGDPTVADALNAALEAPVTLALEDLVRDANGEIVLFNDSNLRALAIESMAAETESGVASQHITAAGEDVSGFRFVRFANGTTLFYQDGLDLRVRMGGA